MGKDRHANPLAKDGKIFDAGVKITGLLGISVSAVWEGVMGSQALTKALAHLARLDTREIPFTDEFSFISAFVARRTETVHSISMPVAGLLAVLEGVKTVI